LTASQRKTAPLKVILDANALFVPLQFKLDIFEEVKRLLDRNVEYILLSSVKFELEVLASEAEPKLRREANFALRIAKKCQVVTVEDNGEKVDDIIVRVAKSWGAPVFTNDRLLRTRLRDISVPVIYLRQKSRLVIDGLIS
jgi:rRNA-processing protein FCF1